MHDSISIDRRRLTFHRRPILRRVRRMYPPDVPVMLAGVSMGGLVATLAVLDAGIAPDGLILVAPLLDVDMSAAMKAQAAGGVARQGGAQPGSPRVWNRGGCPGRGRRARVRRGPRVFVGNLRVGLGYELLKGIRPGAIAVARGVRASPRVTRRRRGDGPARVPPVLRRGDERRTRFVSLEGACHDLRPRRAPRGGDGRGARVCRCASDASAAEAGRREWAAGGFAGGERGGRSAGRGGTSGRGAGFLTFGRGRRGRVRGARIRREGGSTVSWLAGEDEAPSCRLGFLFQRFEVSMSFPRVYFATPERVGAGEKIQTPSFAFFAGLTNPNRPDLESGIKSRIANRLASAT